MVNNAPNQISDSSIIYPPASQPLWSSTTSYVIGNYVTHNKYVYICKANSSAGLIPSDNPSLWLNQGLSVRYLLTDLSTSTYSNFGTSGGFFVILQAQGDSLALLNLNNVGTITVSAVNSSTLVSVYSATTFTLNGKSDFFISNLPNIALTPINITVTLTPYISGNVYVGSCVWGNITDIGDTQYGASTGITDYSYRSTDTFGNLTVTLRTYAKRISSNLMINNSKLDSVFNFLAANRSMPMVWIGSDNTYSSLITFGVWKDFDINIAYPDYSSCSLTVEGLA